MISDEQKKAMCELTNAGQTPVVDVENLISAELKLLGMVTTLNPGESQAVQGELVRLRAALKAEQELSIGWNLAWNRVIVKALELSVQRDRANAVIIARQTQLREQTLKHRTRIEELEASLKRANERAEQAERNLKLIRNHAANLDGVGAVKRSET